MKNLTKAVLLSFFGLVTTETLQAGYLNNYNDPNIERLKSAVQNVVTKASNRPNGVHQSL